MKTIQSKLLLSLPILGLAIYAIGILVFNYSRPFITVAPYTTEIQLSEDRSSKYFSRFLAYENDYLLVKNEIEIRNLKNVGLMLGKYDMEYQLFFDVYRSEVKSYHLNAHEIAEGLPVPNKVDCIVSTMVQEAIEFNGDRYYNATPNNDGYLSLFLKL